MCSEHSVERVQSNFDRVVVRQGENCQGCGYNYTLVIIPLSLTETTACTFNVQSFPFDTHFCDIASVV